VFSKYNQLMQCWIKSGPQNRKRRDISTSFTPPCVLDKQDPIYVK